MPVPKTITLEDFSEVFQDEISGYLKARINDYNFEYFELSRDETDETLKNMRDTLLNHQLSVAGEHRRREWEIGWQENMEMFDERGKLDSLTPRYFEKNDTLRWKQKFIKPVTRDFEKNSLAVIQDWLFDKYMRDSDAIYEFGCGTGHNLLRIRDVNKDAMIWGLDWAGSSQRLVKKIADNYGDRRIYGENFDFFQPRNDFNLNIDSIIFTSAALEQVGGKFTDFLSYLIEGKPRLCIHIEPIEELLDPNNLMDHLSLQYFKKRNYLFGFLKCLKRLEQEGKINIHRAHRTYIGSPFIEGSVVVWAPT